MQKRKLLSLLLSVTLVLQLLGAAITATALSSSDFPSDKELELSWSEDFEVSTGVDYYKVFDSGVHFPYGNVDNRATLETEAPISGSKSVRVDVAEGAGRFATITTNEGILTPGKNTKFTEEIKFIGDMPADFSLTIDGLTWSGSVNWAMQINYSVVNGELVATTTSLADVYPSDTYIKPIAEVEKLGEGHYRIIAKFTAIPNTDGGNTVMLVNQISGSGAYSVMFDNLSIYTKAPYFPADDEMKLTLGEDFESATHVGGYEAAGTALHFPYYETGHSLETENAISGNVSLKYEHTEGYANSVNGIGVKEGNVVNGKYTKVTQEIKFVGDIPADFKLCVNSLTYHNSGVTAWPMQIYYVVKNGELVPGDFNLDSYYSSAKYMKPIAEVEKLGEGHYKIIAKFTGIGDTNGNNTVMLFNTYFGTGPFTLLIDNYAIYSEKEPVPVDVYPENLTAMWSEDLENATGGVAEGDSTIPGTNFWYRWGGLDATTAAQYSVANVANAAEKNAVISGNKSVLVNKTVAGEIQSMCMQPSFVNDDVYVMNFKLKPLGEGGTLPADFKYSLVAMRWEAPSYFFTYNFTVVDGELVGSLAERNSQIYSDSDVIPEVVIKDMGDYYSIAFKFTGKTGMFFYTAINGSPCSFSLDDINFYAASKLWNVGSFVEKTKSPIFNENFEKATIVESTGIAGTNGFYGSWAGLNDYYSVTTDEEYVISGKKSILYEGEGTNEHLMFGTGVTYNDKDYKLVLQLKPTAPLANGTEITLHNMSYSSTGPLSDNYLFSATFVYSKASDEWNFSYNINSTTVYPKEAPRGTAYMDENGILNVGISFTDSLDALGKDNNNWFRLKLGGNLKIAIDNVRYYEAPLEEGVSRYFAVEEVETGEDYDDNVYYKETATPLFEEDFESATEIADQEIAGTELSFPISGMEDYHYITGLGGDFASHSINGGQSLGVIAAGALANSVEIPTSYGFGQYYLYTFKIKANTAELDEVPENNYDYSVFGYTLNGTKDKFFEVKLSAEAGVITGAQVTTTDAYPFEAPECKYVTDENGVTTVVIKFRGGKSTDGLASMKLRTAFSGDYAVFAIDDMAVYKSSSVTAVENFLPTTGTMVYTEGFENATGVSNSNVDGSAVWDVYGGMNSKYSLVPLYSEALNGSKSIRYTNNAAGDQSLAIGNSAEVRFANDNEYKLLFKLAPKKALADGATIKLHYRAWEGNTYLFTVTYTYVAANDSWVASTSIGNTDDYAKTAPIGYSSKADGANYYDFGLSFVGSTTTLGNDNVTFIAFEFSGDFDVILDDFSVIEAPIGESAGRYVTAVSKPVVEADVDDNGIFNSADLVSLRKHLLDAQKVTSEYSLAKADYNSDSVIDIRDLVGMKKKLAK